MKNVSKKYILATALSVTTFSVSALMGAGALADTTQADQTREQKEVTTMQNESRDMNSGSANPAHPTMPSTQKANGKQISKAEKEVHFGFDSVELDDDAKSTLDDLANTFKDQQEIKVELTGYTDGMGDEAYNEDLAERRVKAVKEYLSEKLQDSEVDFDTEAQGESDPVASNESAFGREKNRRVKVTIVSEAEDEEVVSN